YKIDILDKTCTSATFGGPTDGLLLHIPQNYLSSDISQSGHRVQIISEPNTDIPGKEIRPSRTDFENRSIRVDLAPASDTARTISFRSIPGAVLSDRPAMTFEGGAAIALYDSTEQASGLRPHECNQHVAIIRDGQMESWVNGIFAVRPASGQAGGPLTIGPILSKLWDFRIYDRALAPGEIEELSERCTTVKPKFPDLPKATCGVYHCTHYKPFDPAKTTDDHVIYYRTRREESTEWGFLGNALWPHQQYCDFVQNGYGADDELDPSKEATYVNYDELSPITPDSIFERHEWAHWEYGRLFDGQAGSFGCSPFMTETYGPFSAEQVRRGHRDTLIGGLPLVPHAPLWMNREEASGFDGSETPDLMDAHLQAGHTFFTHVSDQLQQSQFMGYLFNSQRCRTEPIAFLRDYFSAKGVDIRNIYSDYASRIATHDLPLGELYRDMEFETFKQLACVNSNVDFRFTTSINRTPPMGWINLQEGRVPGAFAYNLYRIVNTAPGGYNISLDKLTARNRLLVTAVTTDSKDESRKFSCKGTEREYLQPKMTRRRYQTMVVEGDQRESTMTVRTEEGETMFVVVATLPDVYSGYERFPHAIRFELAP
ncbi:MAG TPA: hypothetical protein VM580_24365, partial [Labilithrix sp.]|nr:hypothetical protein [Labilithrix sp.]